MHSTVHANRSRCNVNTGNAALTSVTFSSAIDESADVAGLGVEDEEEVVAGDGVAITAQ